MIHRRQRCHRHCETHRFCFRFCGEVLVTLRSASCGLLLLPWDDDGNVIVNWQTMRIFIDDRPLWQLGWGVIGSKRPLRRQDGRKPLDTRPCKLSDRHVDSWCAGFVGPTKKSMNGWVARNPKVGSRGKLLAVPHPTAEYVHTAVPDMQLCNVVGACESSMPPRRIAW